MTCRSAQLCSQAQACIAAGDYEKGLDWAMQATKQDEQRSASWECVHSEIHP